MMPGECFQISSYYGAQKYEQFIKPNKFYSEEMQYSNLFTLPKQEENVIQFNHMKRSACNL